MKRNRLLGVLGLSLLAGGFIFYLYRSRVSPRDLPGDFVKAVEVPEQLLQEGQRQLRAKQYAPVVETLKRMLAKYPDDDQLKKRLAFAYFASGRYLEAEPLLKELEAKGADTEVSQALGAIAREKNAQ